MFRNQAVCKSGRACLGKTRPRLCGVKSVHWTDLTPPGWGRVFVLCGTYGPTLWHRSPPSGSGVTVAPPFLSNPDPPQVDSGFE